MGQNGDDEGKALILDVLGSEEILGLNEGKEGLV